MEKSYKVTILLSIILLANTVAVVEGKRTRTKRILDEDWDNLPDDDDDLDDLPDDDWDPNDDDEDDEEPLGDEEPVIRYYCFELGDDLSATSLS
jgi:hypothetical protein